MFMDGDDYKDGCSRDSGARNSESNGRKRHDTDNNHEEDRSSNGDVSKIGDGEDRIPTITVAVDDEIEAIYAT